MLDEEDLTPEAIQKEINDKQKIIDDVDYETSKIEKEMAELAKEEQEILERARQLRKKKWDAQQRKANLAHEAIIAKTKQRQLKEKHKASLEARIQVEAWVKMSEELDEIARAQHWFPYIKPYQFDAAKQGIIAGSRFIEADKPGLGKSITSLATADMLGAKKIVIISKKEILRNFEREVRKWAPWRTMLSIVSETKAYRDTVLRVFEKTDEWTILLNFESWRRDRDIITRIKALKPDCVIVDEAHHMKEFEKLNARGVIDIVYANNMCTKCGASKPTYLFGNTWYCNSCHTQLKDKETHSVKHVIPMTGSPILQRPDEIFPALYLLDRERWPRKNFFLKEYCTKREYTTLTGGTSKKWVFTDWGLKKLMNELGPRFIQRSRADVGLELPDQEIQVYELELNKDTHPKQYDAYHTLVSEEGMLYDEKGQGFVTAARVITTILRWRQAAVWPAGIELRDPDTKELIFKCDAHESVKLDKAEEIIKELVSAGERVVLFSKFVAPLTELQRRFNETLEGDEDDAVRSICYYGATPGNVRMEIQNDFDRTVTTNGEHKWDVVLCHFDSAGEGLNFTNATDMVIIDEDWNDQKNFQAYQRIQRIGQTAKTTVHILRLMGTIDEDMANMIADKRGMVASVEDNARIVREIIERIRSKRQIK
jgi:SWI/SNF-related matrix-associated actin-dependent regulator 1 of chromatin subfamily A